MGNFFTDERTCPARARLAPLATRAFTPVFDGLWRGQPGKKENQNSARVRGPLRDSEPLRIAETPPHPDLLHSPSKTGVNALVARGEKESALRLDTLSSINLRPIDEPSTTPSACSITPQSPPPPS